MIESSLTNGGAIKLYTPSPIGQLMVYSHHHSVTVHKASKAWWSMNQHIAGPIRPHTQWQAERDWLVVQLYGYWRFHTRISCSRYWILLESLSNSSYWLITDLLTQPSLICWTCCASTKHVLFLYTRWVAFISQESWLTSSSCKFFGF